MGDKTGAPVEQMLGGILYATAMIQAIIYTLVDEKVIPPQSFATGMDAMLLEWEKITAAPDHALPGALANARSHLEAFLAQFRKDTLPPK